MTRCSLLLLLLGSILCLGCGRAERHLCERAEECDYIGNGDLEECISDLERAVERGDFGRDDIKECRDCVEDNACGVDQFVDCAGSCQGVADVVFGSNFN